MAKKTKAEDQTTEPSIETTSEQAAGISFYSRHPGYRIFDLVQFQDGRAVVSDPAVIARLKADPAFGRDFWEETRA